MPDHRSLPAWPRLLALGAVGLVLLVLAVLGVSTWSWADDLRTEGRLLPATSIDGVDVGGLTADEAVAALRDRVDGLLDRPITVVHGEERWQTSARALGASTNAERVVAAAVRRGQEASLVELTQRRWGRGGDVELELVLQLPDGAGDALIGDIADALDTEVRDAWVIWDGVGLDLTPAQDGLRVDRGSSATALHRGLHDGAELVELTSEVLLPAVTTLALETAAAEVSQWITDALERPVTMHHGEASWTFAPHELGATPDVEPLIEAALAGQSLPPVTFAVDDEAVTTLVAAVSDDIEVAPRDARVEVGGGDVRILPERAGARLDRTGAVEAITAAMAGSSDRVELPVERVQPSVTAASLGNRMLVVDQTARRLHLYQGGAVVRSWPVAVGSGGSPTPTGIFTVGAKRYEPTWTNPAPDRWGSDMPARIGPGPDNPLGARAINWNRGGRDTLIRFHGTPNEDSIGQAASRGCVRMFNADVIELYDLIPSGTTIVSARG
jgi:lipoprotein-anchoring transpeptidase ErfK/SrfK